MSAPRTPRSLVAVLALSVLVLLAGGGWFSRTQNGSFE